MNRPIAEEDVAGKGDEAPLDPAVERVRRKLLRFAIINIGILFLALAVVVAALAWRSVSASKTPNSFSEAAVTLPRGAKVLSQSVAPGEVALLATLADGTSAVFIFARTDGRLVGRYPIAAQ